jgi:HEAT repeat protein
MTKLAAGWICLALASIAWGQTDAAWDVLKKGLQESNPENRKIAAAALGGTGLAPKSINLLEETMANDKDPEVRQAAATSLGEMKARVAIPKLKTAMDGDPQVSFACARALWNMGDRSGRDLIEDIAGAEYKNPTGKMAQAKMDAQRKLHDPQGLAKMGAEQAASALLGPFSIGLKLVTELRKDSGATGRLLAISLLAQECSAEDTSVIESAAVGDKNDAVRVGAIKALGQCGSRGSVPKLASMLSFDKFPVQMAAAATIIKLEGKGGRVRTVPVPTKSLDK